MMSLSVVRAVSRHELRILMSDPIPFALLVMMPVVIASFVKPVFLATAAGPASLASGGAELAVPAMMVMFGFFLTANIGQTFFYEHRWNTWDRVRAEAVRPAEVMAGKAIPYVGLAIVFQVGVLAAGAAVLGLRLRGSLLAIGVTVIAFAITLVGFAFALVAVCRSIRQVQAYSNLLGLVFAGLAGALAPIRLLPGWAQVIAPWTPGYWGLRGLTEALQGATEPTRAALALLGFGVVFGLIGLSQFRPSDRKIYPA